MFIPYSDIKKGLSYAILLFIIFLSTGSSWLSNDKNVIIGGWLLFSIAYFYVENLIKPAFMIMTAIFIIISGLYFIKNGAYNPVTYIGFFIKIYLAYYCRELCKEDFFKYFINIVFVGACISLPMFVLQLISFDFLYNINNFFRVEMAEEARSNSFVFTMLPIHYHRNCGFMWEPGAFAAILVLTLYINTFKEEENILSRKNIIFIICILTTQSTMGVLALMIPVGLVVRELILQNRTYQQLSVVIIPSVLIIFAIVFTKVDFLYAKMASEIAGVEEELAFVEQGQKDNFLVSTTRLTSVILDIQSIKRYPYLGLGVDYQTVSADKLATNELTETACGITALMVRFGVLGLLIYAFLFYKSAFFERKIHRIGWVSLIFFILFSNELSSSAFIHLFVF
jgi:hypothetical protein